MSTKKAAPKGGTKTKRATAPKATSNWFTDAMSEANMGIVRATERKGRKK